MGDNLTDYEQQRVMGWARHHTVCECQGTRKQCEACRGSGIVSTAEADKRDEQVNPQHFNKYTT